MSSLVDFLDAAEGKVRYALLGALAVQSYVPYRYTHDVDVAVHKADLWILKGELELKGYVLVENPRLGKLEFKRRGRGDIDVYTEEISGIKVERLIRRARQTTIFGRKARVISPEDVLLLKCKAGRERDLADAAAILVKLSNRLDWNYLSESSRELKIDLKGFLVRSLERIPLTVDNPPKVRKFLRKLVEEKL